jgi:hypothetical protein
MNADMQEEVVTAAAMRVPPMTPRLEHQGRYAMTSPESENEIEEVISTPATPGAQALPTEADDEDDDTSLE